MTDLIAGIICAVLAAMGVGGGGLLVIYLSLAKDVSQLTAQGINLLFFLPSAAISLLFKRKLFSDRRELIFLICPAAVLSSLVFCLIGGYMSDTLIRRIFGIFLILASLIQMLSFKGKAKKHSGAKDCENGCGSINESRGKK